MIYDHERDAEAERERSLPDWGGDDLFASIPRRRIGHTATRPRRFSGPGTGVQTARRPEPAAVAVTADSGHDGRIHAAAPARVGAAPLPSRPAASQPAAPVAMPRPLPLPPQVAKAVAEDADPFATFVADLAPDAPAHPANAPAATSPEPAAWPRRRREAPPIQERFAVRPDRIAGWAVGLGITLILIAVGTADGGVI